MYFSLHHSLALLFPLNHLFIRLLFDLPSICLVIITSIFYENQQNQKSSKWIWYFNWLECASSANVTVLHLYKMVYDIQSKRKLIIVADLITLIGVRVCICVISETTFFSKKKWFYWKWAGKSFNQMVSRSFTSFTDWYVCVLFAIPIASFSIKQYRFLR